MDDSDLTVLPFDRVSEFKESMRKEYERLLNEFFDVNDVTLEGKSSDKENSVILGDPKEDPNLSSLVNASEKENVIISDDDVSLSTLLQANIPKPKRRYATRKSKYNLRKRTSTVETILVGDAEEDETVDCTRESRVRTLRKRTRNNAVPRQGLVTAANTLNNRPVSEVIDVDDYNLPVNEIIDIDDYDEGATKINPVKNNFADIDMINEEMNVKINWICARPKYFKLRRFEPFSKIFLKLSEEENVDKDCIVLWKGEEKIMPEDTPDSVNLDILDILTGYSIAHPSTLKSTSTNVKKTKDVNALEIKVIRDLKRDKEMFFTINRNQKMVVLFIKIAEHLNYNINRVQLWFDGEKVSENDTPSDLDLEGGECFELKIQQ